MKQQPAPNGIKMSTTTPKFEERRIAMFELIAAILKELWELIGVIAYYCADSFWEG